MLCEPHYNQGYDIILNVKVMDFPMDCSLENFRILVEHFLTR